MQSLQNRDIILDVFEDVRRENSVIGFRDGVERPVTMKTSVGDDLLETLVDFETLGLYARLREPKLAQRSYSGAELEDVGRAAEVPEHLRNDVEVVVDQKLLVGPEFPNARIVGPVLGLYIR